MPNRILNFLTGRPSETSTSESIEEEVRRLATEQKLARLAAASLEIKKTPVTEATHVYTFSPGPLRPGIHCVLTESQDDMYVFKLGLGHPDIERRGIGSLLLTRAVQFGIEEINPRLATVSRNPANSAFVGVMRRTFGAENVTYRVPDHAPPDSDVFCDVQARIDRERIMAVDVRHQLGQLARTGHT